MRPAAVPPIDTSKNTLCVTLVCSVGPISRSVDQSISRSVANTKHKHNQHRVSLTISASILAQQIGFTFFAAAAPTHTANNTTNRADLFICLCQYTQSCSIESAADPATKRSSRPALVCVTSASEPPTKKFDRIRISFFFRADFLADHVPCFKLQALALALRLHADCVQRRRRVWPIHRPYYLLDCCCRLLL